MCTELFVVQHKVKFSDKTKLIHIVYHTCWREKTIIAKCYKKAIKNHACGNMSSSLCTILIPMVQANGNI